MRRVAVPLAVAAVLAALVASAALATDTYIYGTLGARVPGTNEATVNVRWAFKCLGDKLGEATYEYTLVAKRLDPAPTTTVTIRKDTTKVGSTTVRLGPGSWQLQGDPFLCETERGAGSTQSEIGQTVQVPDYCAWTVRAVKGAVDLETTTSVKRARPGLVATPGSSVVTPAGGSASLLSGGKDATASLGAGTRLSVDPAQCRARAGWRLGLASGAVALSAKAGPDGKRDHDVATANALVTGRVGAWSVSVAKVKGQPQTVVAVRSGSVRIKGKTGAALTVKAGRKATVSGSSAPR